MRNLNAFAVRIELTRIIYEQMNRQGVDQMELARRMGVSRQAVNQHLTGGPRTIKVLVDMLHALGCGVRIEAVPYAESVGVEGAKTPGKEE